MPRRKHAKRTTVKDLRSILRLTYELGLSVRAISERLQISKTSVATYLLRAREAGLSWPLPPIYEGEAALQRALFRRVGRPPQDLSEPDWPRVAQELKRKGVTLTLLWQEYRTAHPDGYGYTWFCDKFAVHQRRANPTCSATIWMGTQRQSGWPFRRSRREDICRGTMITQAIFS
jgi:transposase